MPVVSLRRRHGLSCDACLVIMSFSHEISIGVVYRTLS